MGPSSRMPAAVLKVHKRLLPLFSALIVVCYLDRTALAFAALQLCHEPWFDAKVYGLGSALFYAGYVVFQVPSNLMLARVGPRIWLPAITAAWGAVAACCVFISGPASFYALRMALGVTEAGAFPACWHICGQFYPSTHITVAYSVIEASIAISQIIAAPVAAALLQLSGLWGLAGWQHLFLAEGLATLAMAGVLRWRLPGSITTADFLSPEDKLWLLQHLEPGGATAGGGGAGGAGGAGDASAHSQQGSLHAPMLSKQVSGSGSELALSSMCGSRRQSRECLAGRDAGVQHGAGQHARQHSDGSLAGSSPKSERLQQLPEQQALRMQLGEPPQQLRPGQEQGRNEQQQQQQDEYDEPGTRLLAANASHLQHGAQEQQQQPHQPHPRHHQVPIDSCQADGAAALGVPDDAQGLLAAGDGGAGADSAARLLSGATSRSDSCLAPPLPKQQQQQQPRPALSAWQQLALTAKNKLILYLMLLKAFKDVSLDGLVYFVPLLIHALIDGSAALRPPGSGAAHGGGKHCGGKDSQLRAVLLSAIPFGTAAVAALALGHSSQVSQERHRHVGVPLLLGGCVFAALPALLPLRSHVPAFLAVTAAVVAADATTGPFWTWVHMAAAPGTQAVSLAAVNSVGKAGGMLGPLSFGLLLASTGSYVPSILFVAGVLLAGGVMALLYPDDKGHARQRHG